MGNFFWFALGGASAFWIAKQRQCMEDGYGYRSRNGHWNNDGSWSFGEPQDERRQWRGWHCLQHSWRHREWHQRHLEQQRAAAAVAAEHQRVPVDFEKPEDPNLPASDASNPPRPFDNMDPWGDDVWGPRTREKIQQALDNGMQNVFGVMAKLEASFNEERLKLQRAQEEVMKAERARQAQATIEVPIETPTPMAPIVEAKPTPLPPIRREGASSPAPSEYSMVQSPISPPPVPIAQPPVAPKSETEALGAVLSEILKSLNKMNDKLDEQSAMMKEQKSRDEEFPRRYV